MMRFLRATWPLWAMSAAAWIVTIALAAVVVHRCDEEIHVARAYPCSAEGRRGVYNGWLVSCLHESTRSTAECEVFAQRQAHADALADGCAKEAEASKR